MKKGDVLTSPSGRTAKITKVTTKLVTVEVERRILNKSTGELKVEKRTREIPVDRWSAFAKGYKP